MELKLDVGHVSDTKNGPFNRTTMELKLEKVRLKVEREKLLIEPLWN